MSTIILAIKPKYAAAILTGDKLVEYRKTIPKKMPDYILLYVVSPVKKIVAKAKVTSLIQGPILSVWAETQFISGITLSEYIDYYQDRTIAYAYKLANIEAIYPPYKTLSDYGIKHPVQSWVYLPKQEVSQ